MDLLERTNVTEKNGLPIRVMSGSGPLLRLHPVRDHGYQKLKIFAQRFGQISLLDNQVAITVRILLNSAKQTCRMIEPMLNEVLNDTG